MDGVVFFYFESGTEGGSWAFQDSKHITQHSTLGPQFSYDGLHILNDGDHLTIYDKSDSTKVIWEGLIVLKWYSVFTETTEDGFWIHNDQVGVERDIWSKFFFEEYPARLVKK